MSQTLQRRLPGVRFDVPAPPLDEALPRMDIAFFVGFAASGPLEVPVAVESLAEFEAVFGAEIVLLDKPDGSPLLGLLHPSVRQFFSHGGRRAWVLRVAGPRPRTTRFPLPQMLRLLREDPAEGWRIEPAWIAARCPGSWADALRVGVEIEAQPIAVQPAGFDGARLDLVAFGPLALAVTPGDTLRIALQEGEWLQGRIAQTGAVTAAPAGARLQRAITLTGLASLRRWERQPQVLRAGWFEPTLRGDGTVQRQVPASGEWLADGRLTLRCEIPAQARLAPGEVLRVAVEGSQGPAWMVLETAEAAAIGGADGSVDARLTGRPWRVPTTPARTPLERWLSAGGESTAQWLRARLSAAEPDGDVVRLEGLALGRRQDGGPSLTDLPDDERFFSERGRAQSAGRVVRSFELAERAAAGQPAQRFPLASVPLAGEVVLLPLDLGVAPAAGLPARGIELPPLLRDGLDRFAWDLFAEPALAEYSADALRDQAEAFRVLGRTPRPLRGLHAVFGAAVAGPAEEPTLLVVPDAVQPGWQRKRQRDPARRLHPPLPQPQSAPCGCFDDCARTPLAAPAFLDDADPDAAGNYRLSWTRPEPVVQFELQEATDSQFVIATLAYAGSDAAFAVTGKPRGVLWYRVRALDGLRVSPWSGALEVRVATSLYEQRAWRADDLLALHRLMLRAAAGRGDMLAVLGLPEHYRWADAIAHANALREDLQPAFPRPLGTDETRAHSHGALHHPWLHTRRVDTLITCPPDGAVAGQLAANALARGAWFAVANRPLRDVVALTLPAGEGERQALLEAQVNPVVSAPAGFVLATAETLALDADWRPVNVRRLLSLLLRAALRRGATYVFEPNGRTLQRTVERAFEAMLQSLFVRGAFAGRSPGESFQVEVGAAVNTPARADAGQFWVELRVAPSLPLTFLTVRLVRSGERLVSQELR